MVVPVAGADDPPVIGRLGRSGDEGYSRQPTEPVKPKPPATANGVSAGLPSGAVTYGSMVVLTASKPEATVYYTTDGSDPRKSATRKHAHVSPIKVLGALQLRTCAVYHPTADSTVVSAVSIYRYTSTCRILDADEAIRSTTSSYSIAANVYVATDHLRLRRRRQRIARASTASGSVVYHTDHDITSFRSSATSSPASTSRYNCYYASKGTAVHGSDRQLLSGRHPGGQLAAYVDEALSLPANTLYLKSSCAAPPSPGRRNCPRADQLRHRVC